MKRKLWNGIRIEVIKLFGAGQIYVHRVDMLSHKLTYELSGGQPYDCAYNEAEQLAITIDAEFVVNGEIKRESISGEYQEFDN